jgi:hypothetical protein
MNDAFRQAESIKASQGMEKVYWLTKFLLRFTKTWTDEVSSQHRGSVYFESFLKNNLIVTKFHY